MSKVTRRDWYARVNALWPADVPELTADEAVRAARKLYRFAMRMTFAGEVKVTSGNRYTWIRGRVLSVNPQGRAGSGYGWKSLVHDLSHYTHLRLSPETRPHASAHARLEMRMIREVIKRGWLDGTLKSAPKPKPPKDAKLEKLLRTEAAIARWESKLKRAQTALKKLRRRQTYYARAAGRDSATLH